MQVNGNPKEKEISSQKTDLTVNPGFVEEIRLFKMIGDSMDSGLKGSIRNGDFLNVAKIAQDSTSANQPANKNRIYVFQTRWGLIIKEVTRIEEHSVFCTSLNSDKDLYPDFEIEFSDISAIYEVTSVSRTL
ncbi:S24 family peptidase [Dyadobacter sp. LHD-138]|uniref:S24 family peptidase n=1 Tax=Dyadobacter sp. LHD-138 TaxID=3071413 RepID=UPI0027DF7A16|nr:S24 family peptidase [Dyadobacter sp. LHD-138]MDQ6480001.1 S24 family peptidase [Dyadobacter sp. LHD-138]